MNTAIPFDNSKFDASGVMVSSDMTIPITSRPTSPFLFQESYSASSGIENVLGSDHTIENNKFLYFSLDDDFLLSGLLPSFSQPNNDLALLQQQQQAQDQLQQQHQLQQELQQLQVQQQQQAFQAALQYPSSPLLPFHQMSCFPSVDQPLNQTFPGTLIDPITIPDFRQFRSPTFDRMGSPASPLSPVSDQGFFEMTDDEFQMNGFLGDLLARPLEELDMSPRTTARPRKLPPQQLNPTNPISHVTSALKTTIPALSSPLKHEFGPGSFTDSDEEGFNLPTKKKRVRKPTKPKTAPKVKAPRLRLNCPHTGCGVTCSSHPSLARHFETHRWRGLYAPVRCEACQSSLSNEFSVQRHIMRSLPTSRCRRMRVYSVMKSETEIEATVRFYPKRPHGKKTAAIDLEHARNKYQ